MPENIPLPSQNFDTPSFAGRWFDWAEVEKCFWPGRGKRAKTVNPLLAPVCGLGGVYLLASCGQAPKIVHPRAQEVRYMGQTNDFRMRLGQFARSAGFWGERDSGHSAAWRWPKGATACTWVAFFHIGESFPDHIATGLRCWMEAVALEEHRLANGAIPKGNRKLVASENSGKRAGGDAA